MEGSYHYYETRDQMNHVRQLFMAMPLFFLLGLAVLPIRAEDHVGHGAALAYVAATFTAFLWSDHHVARAATVNQQTKHQHGHSDLDDCHATAGHCAPGIAVMVIDGHGHLVSRLTALRLIFGEAFRAGLRPLPLLPPPEYV